MPDLDKLPFTIADLHKAYAQGVRPSDVVVEAFRRLEAAHDPGMFISLLPRAEAMARADALGSFDPDARGLFGVPFAIKDNIDLARLPTTAACPAFEYRPDADATTVARLLQAGAIPLGKTNLDQFATGLVGVRSPYPPPRNAIDASIVPGGSSSGSAVATAHGIVSFALGTDTAGSGRVPAALNNVVGLKPTLGMLSNTGVVPACRTLDTVSIFALTVEDAYRVFETAAGFDTNDAFSRALRPRPLGTSRPWLKVGIPAGAQLATDGDAHQRASFEAACRLLEQLGCELLEIDFQPFFEVAAMLYQGAWVAERYTVVEDLLRTRSEALHPVTRQIIGGARDLSAADAFRGIYRLAELRRLAEPVLASVDLLCVPTIPRYVSLSELEADPIGPNSMLGTYTNFVNLMDLCGIAVPTAARADGRPGSITLLARAGEDHLVAGLASAIHRASSTTLGATGWRLPPASSPSTRIGEDEFAIAVCGAHMSGLPLNHELTRRGARLVRASRTEARYRLYHLAGSPPDRPGLVQDHTGAEIDIEIWALPMMAAGGFIAGIPYPLGIGTITTAQGESVQGFVCDPAALAGATDITAHGGWRAYLAAR